ncbi:cell envelope biogenesis protein TonB [Labilibaculum antarcticum]|uniref:Cell envelope biogenesis protein TonB n=2 Tax=Labilibaculum antarcticum TaxID=1717717 RepID=A0A1Y1CN82_9BACT|nr:cell envelope biogenesis protein TonB [Labilibaculum antarcticum]
MITGIILYFLQSAICMAFFYALYWLFLKKDTFFRINRVFLLLTLLASVLIPTLEIPFQPEPKSAIENPFHVLDAVVIASQQYLNSNMLEEVVVTATVNKVLTGYQYLGIVYILGVFLFSIRFFKNLFQLLSWTKSSQILREKGLRLVIMNDDYPPFSFLNSVFIGKADYKKANFTSIIAHERVHVDQLHTFDLLMIEILTVVFWLNPVVWFYKYSIQEVHEYLADDKVVNGAVNANEYKMHIVNQFAGGDLFRLANNFGQSTLKKRITMLGRLKTPRIALVKLLLIIPIFMVLLSAFAFTIKEEEKLDSDFSFKELLPTDLDLFSSFKRDPINFYNETKNDFPIYSPAHRINKLEYKETINLDEIKTITDEMPVFPGGVLALQKYIAKHVKYPKLAQSGQIEGRVFVSFVVNKEGNVINVALAKKVHPQLDREALRVVSSLPKWIPGKKDGEFVNISYTVPINFQLKNLFDKPITSPDPLQARIKNASDYHLENILRTNKSKEYVLVEKMPQFTEANGHLRRYIARKIQYPVLAADQGYEGQVFVQFVVTTDGSVAKAKVIKGANVELNKEALRVINNMPNWVPGEQQGKKVEVRYTIPIRFSLN